MIFEFLTSLLTPAPKWARRMGYVHEAIAIKARAKRCQVAWASHQNKTKTAILEAVKERVQNRTVLIVGSGACLDIPLRELADIFERVVLVDIVHPPKSRSHGLNNVVHVTLDITNQIEGFYNNPDVLPDAKVPTIYHDFPDIDFVLSVNVASQLAVIPLHYAALKLAHEDDALIAFSKNLIQAHFKWLSGFKCPSALICDRMWELLDPAGKRISVEDPLYGVNLNAPSEMWCWDVAPLVETGAGFARRNQVGYWPNFLFTAIDNTSASFAEETMESK